METVPPTTDLETKIINNEFYQAALLLGKKRETHPEGQLGVHVDSIINHINRNYKDKYPEYYQDLVTTARLHDAGKLGRIDELEESFPDGATPEVIKLITDKTKEFVERFPITPDEESDYVPSHAIYSAKFAESLGVSGPVLALIRYHDSGSKFMKEAKKNNGQYNETEFLKIFGSSGLDLKMFLLFNLADNNARKADATYWLQDQLISHGLLSEPVLPKPEPEDKVD